MKKKELLIIVISVLATLTITISGYIVYKNLNEDKNNKNIEERISKLQSKIKELNDSIKQSKEKDIVETN